MSSSEKTLPVFAIPDSDGLSERFRNRARRRHRPWAIVILAALTFLVLGTHIHLVHPAVASQRRVRVPPHAAATQARCANLRLKPAPPPGFLARKASDRFVPGTRATLVRNATIWTGRVNGLEIIKGDLLIDKGLIKAFGVVEEALLNEVGKHDVVDAQGSWLTPGIVDLHSHIGADSAPELRGSEDYNSGHGLIQPWLRVLDGLNTHDDAYKLSISGGITTALVLPGSGNGIGGQGFVIKLRDTAERSPTSKLLEPPFTLNSSSNIDYSLPPRWRQMKHACGENPMRIYGNVRMDNIWGFREAYDKARKIKEAQDEYCDKALNDEWTSLGAFPEDLQWEALVDVLRGRVKVHIHCYETVDLDDIVRLTNEFKFPVAAFHHAHETYLVPDLLKTAYEHPPAAALFATNARYKREAYRGSEFAPRILAQNGINVVMKSDHPVLNSRFLLYEAQQAHYYGLPSNIALASVTTTPAQVMGLEHRIGLIKEGFDADFVIWDSHPLALGATPKQVFIDGIAQLENPHVHAKPDSFQDAPQVPNFDREAADAVKYEGLPPLLPEKRSKGTVVFVNVQKVYLREVAGVKEAFVAQNSDDERTYATVVVRDGKIACLGRGLQCSSAMAHEDSAEIVDLKGGALAPALVSYGSPLGLQEIESESSTYDGYVYDPLVQEVPSIIGGDSAVIHASDGLQYTTRDALLGYRAGVSLGVTAPQHRRFTAGLSTAFALGAAHKLDQGALVQPIAALHISVGHFGKTPSVSTQIAALRRLLLAEGEGDAGYWFKNVREGKLTLVVEVQSADIISTLLVLKKEVEQQTGVPLKLTLSGAAEAHLLAKEIAAANVGVVVVPSRPFPYDWQSRRILPGPPLTSDSAISRLLEANVTVGIGIEENWSARNIRFDAAWAAMEAPEVISKTDALALASTNLEALLGLDVDAQAGDLVATETGDILDFSSKVVGIISPRRGVVDLF